jgi:Bifunctional DNA primase/polymerase, N-terminal
VIYALCTGVLLRDAEAETAKLGKPYASGLIRVGEGQAMLFVFIRAFDEAAEALLGLTKGDAVFGAGQNRHQRLRGPGRHAQAKRVHHGYLYGETNQSLKFGTPWPTRDREKSAVQRRGRPRPETQTTTSHSNMSANFSFLVSALGWLDRGFPVFPLRPRDKIPLGELVPHGFKDACRDRATIREWWTEAPTANIGIATGVRVFLGDARVFVVDAEALRDQSVVRDFGDPACCPIERPVALPLSGIQDCTDDAR